MAEHDDLTAMTAEIVSAYLENHQVKMGELPGLIQTVHHTLSHLTKDVLDAADRAMPAVSVKKSITAEYLICLEDGRKFKSLKRHLRTRYNMTPEEYRSKWGLPADYPMVAPNYARVRSNLAKNMGLGQSRKDGI
jgi:predicted transcriptional regulator